MGFDGRHRRWVGLGAALVVVLSGAAACGGGSAGEGATPSTTIAEAATTARVATTAAPTTTAPTTTTSAVPETTTTTTPPPLGPGPFGVVVEERGWTDPSRPTGAAPGRRLPVRWYLPAEGGRVVGPAPVLVWAHGLDATVDYFDDLLRAWAARGYAVVAPTFPLTNAGAGDTSDDDVANQPADVSFVLDQVLAELGPGGAAHPGSVDPTRIAVAGHSLGGQTALALAGSRCCTDERVRAVVSVDGRSPEFAGGDGATAVPLLLLHGDADATYPLDRSREVYEAATATKHLVVLEGAPHTPFRLEGPAGVIEATVVDFLDAELKGFPGAADALRAHAQVAGVARLEG